MTGTDAYISAKLAMAELLLSGCTCTSGERRAAHARVQALGSQAGRPAFGLEKARADSASSQCHVPVRLLMLKRMPHSLPCRRPPVHLPQRRDAGRHHPCRTPHRHALPPDARHHDAGQEQGCVGAGERAAGQGCGTGLRGRSCAAPSYYCLAFHWPPHAQAASPPTRWWKPPTRRWRMPSG